MSVTVSVPATVANLGPGFDCLALALEWRNLVTISFAHETLIEVNGPGEDRIPRDDTNLVLRTVRACEARANREPREYAIRIHNETPYGRGFGSSAAAIVAGVVGAGTLLEFSLPELEIAGEIEGHLDNVSAALLGGITISGFSPDDAMRVPVPDGIGVLVCVAADRLSTSTARKALPDSIVFGDATFNLARVALLTAALVTGDFSRIVEATNDALHQPYRFEIAPDTQKLIEALRSHGYAAFLSGAGPSVAALIPRDSADSAESLARQHAPQGWHIKVLPIAESGAKLL